MREDEVLGLGLVALDAGFILAVELGATTFDGRTLVGIMAITTTHLTGKHRVGVRQAEISLLVEVALEASFGTLLRVDDGACTTASLNVLASWSVARFATDVGSILALRLKFGVICSLEVAHGLLVTGCAFLGTDKLSTGDRWRGHQRPACAGTGNEDDRQGGAATGEPQSVLSETAHPMIGCHASDWVPQGFHNICWVESWMEMLFWRTDLGFRELVRMRGIESLVEGLESLDSSSFLVMRMTANMNSTTHFLPLAWRISFK